MIIRLVASTVAIPLTELTFSMSFLLGAYATEFSLSEIWAVVLVVIGLVMFAFGKDLLKKWKKRKQIDDDNDRKSLLSDAEHED